jgi:hypothetical protein
VAGVGRDLRMDGYKPYGLFSEFGKTLQFSAIVPEIQMLALEFNRKRAHLLYCRNTQL